MSAKRKSPPPTDESPNLKRVRSAHEKSVAPLPPPPAVTNEWNSDPKVVLASTQFQSLLQRHTALSWADAVALVGRVGIRYIDSSRSYGGDSSSTPNPLVLWAASEFDADDDSELEEGLVRRVFKILMQTGARPFLNYYNSVGTVVGTPLEMVLSGCVSVHHMRCLLSEPTLETNYFDGKTAPALTRALDFEETSTATSQSVVCQLIERVSGPNAYQILNWEGPGYRLTPLEWTVKVGSVNELRCLLGRLPVVELDRWVQDDVDGGPSGRWCRAVDLDVDEAQRDLVLLLIGTAYQLMDRYRYDRAALVRELLGDILPFDLFPIIDSFGAAP